jgi:hypothetical protein
VNVLDVLANILFIVPFVVLPFLIVNWVRYMKVRTENKSRFAPRPVRFPVMSVLFFAGPIIIVGVIGEIMATRSRVEALSFLRGLSGNHKVYVNSQPAHDPDRVINALQEVTPQPAHHSHPTKRIRVEIQSEQGNLILELGRDSGYGQEYWVFYPKYHATSDNEIGRITTPVFDEY